HVDLPGCGHVPMSDDPDLVASVILATTGAGRPAGQSAPTG
ncbi:MAG: alpha/beta hydrolase, partial [Dactylosporangium sp.]|nr:alpha/beta hydrolase [Dactylosporangium sp.]